VQNARYIVVSYDEVTIIDNRSQCIVHAYVVDGFKRMLLLLNLEMVFGGGSTNNLITLILRSLVEYGGLIVEHITSKLVCFGSDGVVVFIGVHTGVSTQLKSNFAHLLTLVHYMAHWTNLTMKTLLALPFVLKLEGMLQNTYTYFSSSLKRHLEQCALAKLLET
jgi:hypothetical protein